MQFDILTIFPQMFAPLQMSILGRAQATGLLTVNVHDIRAAARDRHHTVDDAPFGGGAGMVFKPEVIWQALAAVLDTDAGDEETPPALPDPHPPVIYLSPTGEVLTQQLASELAREPRLVLICGHYEGIDERLREHVVDREISIGDYVLTGGELAAMVLVDAVARLQPGVLAAASPLDESHSDGLLEYPHYTRPATWRGLGVPPVLMSGHHAQIARWRHEQRLLRTLRHRADLLGRAPLSDRDRTFLRTAGWDETTNRFAQKGTGDAD
ncbi:MAG: tRNA (guanosine(37)-N1)-methyltransferase TrmD [Herpetosiphonaceae bacterium]|nr:tRNA (guanosine(37)-N1)-methyltransferase TrmD [Herpetosiphonaceae bacterium]